MTHILSELINRTLTSLYFGSWHNSKH